MKFRPSIHPILTMTVVVLVLATLGTVTLPGDWWDPRSIRNLLAAAGAWGPAILVGTMAVAVVVSPIPSAPLTMASGVMFGPIWGAIYALIGAQLGAMIAFLIARHLGRVPIARIAAEWRLPSRLTSQNALTLTVIAARLVPAVSFDAVSYLAGLTPISLLRFSLATLLGMIPMTLLFSNMGSALMLGDRITLALSLMAIAAATIVASMMIWSRTGARGQAGSPK